LAFRSPKKTASGAEAELPARPTVIGLRTPAIVWNDQ
jgi:hypothetical protein